MIEIKCLRLTLAQPRVASSSATTKGQSDVMSVGTCALSIAPGSSFEVSCLSQFVVAAFRTGLACGRRDEPTFGRTYGLWEDPSHQEGSR
jgi:hypothetical protein